jgi:hypothetical protein
MGCYTFNSFKVSAKDYEKYEAYLAKKMAAGRM